MTEPGSLLWADIELGPNSTLGLGHGSSLVSKPRASESTDRRLRGYWSKEKKHHVLGLYSSSTSCHPHGAMLVNGKQRDASGSNTVATHHLASTEGSS